VERTVPLEARTTVTELEPRLGTQMFEPSKIGRPGEVPTVTVWRMTPAGSSLKTKLVSAAQTLPPSKRMPATAEKPAVTVVTRHGIVAPGVTMETEPGAPRSPVQILEPSKASA